MYKILIRKTSSNSIFFFMLSCSNDKDFFLTKENALISCGKNLIIENENEEIINTVKDLIDGIGKYKFTVAETDKKGGKYRIINVSQVKNRKYQ